MHTSPHHVGIIMDGNGRWAKQRGLPRTAGHLEGAKTVRIVIETALRLQIPILSLFAFSTENWRRPQDEVSELMNLLRRFIKSELNALNQQGIRLCFIGDLKRLENDIQVMLHNAAEKTKDNTGMVLVVALNYSGRSDILQAVRTLLISQQSPESINEESLAAVLSTSDLPDPDLIIRTSGEQRLSNFFLWQAAYSELYFSPLPWPSFDAVEFERALDFYASRQRRFGGTTA